MDREKERERERGERGIIQSSRVVACSEPRREPRQASNRKQNYESLNHESGKINKSEIYEVPIARKDGEKSCMFEQKGSTAKRKLVSPEYCTPGL